MRVLWLCNIMLPIIAQKLGYEASNKEGWLTGLSGALLAHREESGICLGVCFPMDTGKEDVRFFGETDGISYYGFREDVKNPERYEQALVGRLKSITQDFNPDIVHCFGTEYPHTLAMTKVVSKEKILIGLQGMCGECAAAYMADLPERIRNRFLLRDFLKHDNIALQQKKFAMRGQQEAEAIKGAGHLAGRTEFDRRVSGSINPKARYHVLNETLRPVFYKHKWQFAHCTPYRIFVSQGNYPLKGLHYLLWAMPGILARFPETTVYVAGDDITRFQTLKEKLKISSYGKYLRDEICRCGLQDKVFFLGRLSAEEMCEAYLQSHVFVSASSMENSPNSVGEAMLLGMPVVSSKVGGTESLMTDEKEGLFYPHQDTAALTAAVCRIFEDASFAGKLGEQARERAALTHDPDTNYRQLTEIYQAMAKKEE